VQASPESQPRLLSIEAAASYIGVSKWTLRDLIFRGDIPCVRIKRRLLVDVLDLDAYIARFKIQHPA